MDRFDDPHDMNNSSGRARIPGLSLLKVLSVAGQMLALFPFAVAYSGVGAESYSFRRYCVVYAVWAAFYAIGFFFGSLSADFERGTLIYKKKAPVVIFLSRAAVLIPTAGFVAVVIVCGLNSTLFFYVLPAAVIAYFGARGSVGKGYSDIFTRAWFVLHLLSAVFAAVMLWFTNNEEILASGVRQLCIMFAAMILLSALLANQTNIDLCTRQRAGGKSVLPVGLRRYNALLIGGICVGAMGLFLFARPIAELLGFLMKILVRGLLFLVGSCGSALNEIIDTPDAPVDDPDINIPDQYQPNDFAQLLYVLFIIGMLVVIFLARKQILEAVKFIFAPLFRYDRRELDIPFTDEILTSDAKRLSARSLRKTERELIRQYRRESSPGKKYRIGYALFLIRLGRTSQPPTPADTTTVHREKGECAFETDLGELSGVYERVRYGDTAPTAEELARQEQLLAALK